MMDSFLKTRRKRVTLAQPLPYGMVGRWNFRNGSGIDHSLKGNHITWAGAPTYTGGGIALNGSSQYGDLGTGADELNLSSAWSLFFVFKMASDAANNTRLWSRTAAGAGLDFMWMNTEKIAVLDGTNFRVGGTEATVSVVHSGVAVESGGKINLYVDGALSGDADQTFAAVAKASCQTNIGADSAGANFAKGTIYEVMAFNRALSVAEVGVLHNLSGI